MTDDAALDALDDSPIPAGVGAAVLAAAMVGTSAPALTTAQVDLLLEPLHPGRVKQHKGNDHLEAWDVRRWLLRVFGWGGWDLEVLETVLLYERHAWPKAPEGETLSVKDGRHSAGYRVTSRLTIKDPSGRIVAHFDDAAVGGSSNQREPDAAHDQALKTAHSQALKRCAVNLGDAFGLSLYAKLDGPAAVVGRSVAHPGTIDREAHEDVGAGELDEAREPVDPPRQQAARPTPETAEDFLAALSAEESEARVHGLRQDAGLADLLDVEVTVRTADGPVTLRLDEAFTRRLARLEGRRTRAAAERA